jgi:DNA-binding transcriptional regulator YiaG
MRRSQNGDAALIRELTLRECRIRLGLSQRQMAVRLAIDLETYRVLDSGRRQAPIAILARARLLMARVPATGLDHLPDPEPQSAPVNEPLLSLPVLAGMIGIHVRTLWNAARLGQLTVVYDTRTTFRQLRSRSTLTEARRYRDQNYGRRHLAHSLMSVPTWAAIPRNYDARVRRLRRRMHLTQGAFARQLGAANKAVIYQWESRKRCPSPVFWQRIEALAARL